MDRSIRRLSKQEFQKTPVDKLLTMEGLVPLSKACVRFGLRDKDIRNKVRSMTEEEAMRELGVVSIREPGKQRATVLLLLSKVKDLLPQFSADLRDLDDHDFSKQPRPVGWYPERQVLHHYPLLTPVLDEIKASRHYREGCIYLPGALEIGER